MNTDSTRLNDTMHFLREITINLTRKGEYDNAKMILDVLETLKNFAPALDELGDEARKFAMAHEKIDAIVALRKHRPDFSLKEAKDTIEAFMASKGLSI